MFAEKSGGRIGKFDRTSVMEQPNCWVTCGGSAATSDTRKKDKRFNSLRLKWTAPPDGVGSITFKCTLVPKSIDDPDLVGMYGLNVSLDETMPPRKLGSSGFASTRRFDIKPKIELGFDVAFNHNHLLTLFQQNELKLAEHFLTTNVKCTLPLGKLGVQKAKGAKEVSFFILFTGRGCPPHLLKLHFPHAKLQITNTNLILSWGGLTLRRTSTTPSPTQSPGNSTSR